MRWMVVALLFLLSAPALAADLPATRPNVVLFVSDDHGRDAGCYGNTVVKTPHLDALAADGVRYDRAFCTTASCSASRSVILSGLHNHLTGQYGHTHHFHHFSSFTTVYSLPAILTDAGYRTARIGKFHVAPDTVYRFSTVLPSAGGSRNGVAMADNCREFLADRSAPFFLYFCTSDPHRGGGPVKDDPTGADSFGNHQAYPGVTEVKYDPKDVIVPGYLPDLPAVRHELAQYYQAVSRADQGVGRLVRQLKETGQWDNTVFIYIADNGTAMPGSKTTLYEPGMRLPLIVRTPWLKERGTARDSMVSWVDLTPTILDFAGVKEVIAPPVVQGENEDGTPRRRPGKVEQPYEFHGRSFRATLDKDDAAIWNVVFGSHTFHEITMYYPMRVIRTERYKLIYNVAHQLPFPFASDLYESATWQSVLSQGNDQFGKRKVVDFIHRPKFELYDLKNDPDESKNLAADPALKQEMDVLQTRLRLMQEKTRDPWFVKYVYE